MIDGDARRQQIVIWLGLAVALLLLLLFAYIGHFSRLMSDDYCTLAVGRDLGPWQGMLHWFNTRSSSYTNFFLQGVLAPLDTAMPIITPALIIVIWFIGLYWLVFQGLSILNPINSRRLFALTLAALVVAVSIHALHSMQSFFWQSASTDNLLPLAVLTNSFAFAVWHTRRYGGTKNSYLAGFLAAVLCFLTAGMSEMFLVFQLVFLTLMIILSWFTLAVPWRQHFTYTVGICWLASIVSLLIQLSSPGIAIRSANTIQAYGVPNRSALFLATETISRTYAYIVTPQVLGGFLMLLCLGLLVTLLALKPERVASHSRRVNGVMPGMWLLLLTQLVLAPLLWTQISNDPQVLGRYSLAFSSVIVINLGLITSVLLALRLRLRLRAKLGEMNERVRLIFLAISFVASFASLALMTQVHSIDILARFYLLATLFTILLLITQQLLAAAPTSAVRSVGWLAILYSASAVLCTAALVVVALYGRGFVAARILAPASCALVFSGLLWGTFLGYLIKSSASSADVGKSSLRILTVLCFVVILAIGGDVIVRFATLIPDFRQYAQEWDMRHIEIIRQRDAGNQHVEVQPLSFDLAAFIYTSVLDEPPSDRCAAQYYGVDSITVIDPHAE